MENKREMMKQTISLIETVQEGLAHVQQQIKGGQFEATISLFEDIVHAYERIENAMNGLDDKVLSEEAVALQERIVKGLDTAVQAYEADTSIKVQEVLQFTLVPAFGKWHDQLDMDFAKCLEN